MAKVEIHEDVTNHKSGGVDWNLLEKGDIVACVFDGDILDTKTVRYRFDPDRNHPDAISHHRLLVAPPPNDYLTDSWHHYRT